MDPYGKKLKKIKHTIEEIREDIQLMQTKSEQTRNDLLTSLEKINLNDNNNQQDLHNQRIEIESLSDLNEENDHYHYHKHQNSIYNEKYNNYPGISNVNTNFNSNGSRDFNEKLQDSRGNDICFKTSAVLFRNTCQREKQILNAHQAPYEEKFEHDSDIGSAYQKTSHSVELKKQISELQVVISELQRKNTKLQNELSESQKCIIKHENDVIVTNENIEKSVTIIDDIKNHLHLKDSEEILPTIKQLLNTQNDLLKRDELIEKLKILYLALVGQKNGNYVELKTLWRWIKHLIKTVKVYVSSASEAEKSKLEEKDIQRNKKKEKYEDYCSKLIKEYNLQDISELQEFINRLLAKNNLNFKRVEKLKKVLLVERPVVTKCNLSYGN